VATWLCGQSAMTREDSGLDIPKKRYPRGETTKPECEDMTRDILAYIRDVRGISKRGPMAISA